jgi:hypothetical protein
MDGSGIMNTEEEYIGVQRFGSKSIWRDNTWEI